MLIQLIILRRIGMTGSRGRQVLENPVNRMNTIMQITALHLGIAVQSALIISAGIQWLTPTIAMAMGGHDPDLMAVINGLSDMQGPFPMTSMTVYFTIHAPAAVTNGCVRRAYVIGLSRRELATQAALPIAAACGMAILLLATVIALASIRPETGAAVVWAAGIGLAFVDMEISMWAAEWWDDWTGGDVAKNIRRAFEALRGAAKQAGEAKPQPRPAGS